MVNWVPRRLGRYEMREPLGRGGMAEVWLAFDTQLRRLVAIKLMHANLSDDPEFVSRFTREAQTIAALRHPNIVPLYDFQVASQRTDDVAAPDATIASAEMVAPDGSTLDALAAAVGSAGAIAYMVMAYVRGQNLAQFLKSDARAHDLASAAAIIRLFAPIALALDYAHQQGVIHRDIKPANILLDASMTARNLMGEPILSDFGLAKLLEGSTATITGAVLGTPLYMSPEQIQDKPLTSRSDLYSLGVVLYEVCAGAPPFDGESLPGIMLRHINEPPPPPERLNPSLPSTVSDVLVKALAKDPADRFESAAALVAALAAAFAVPAPEELALALTVADGAPSTSSADAAQRETIASRGSVALGTGSLVPSTADATVTSSPETPRGGIGASERSALGVGGATLTKLRTDLAPRLAKAVSAVRAPAAERAPSVPPAGPAGSIWRPRGPRELVALALICVLVLSTLGAFFILRSHSTTAAPVASNVVGQAFFVTSGQVNASVTTGINDEFQINLQGIPAPQAGKSYYAWLLPDLKNSEAPDLLLGKLTVRNGAVHFLYTGDSQHTDLLAITSRFLITEEASDVTPDVPTPDLSAWRYYAALPQTPAPGQQYSLLDHLRHLLAVDPELEAVHLHGGLTIWAFRNTQQILAWSLNARDAWNAKNYDVTRDRAIAMLDYLDGAANVGRDLPAGAPVLADRRIAQVGLLEFDPAHQNPPGYLYHIALHLNGVLQAPGATTGQRTQATKISATLDSVKSALTQTRHDAAQLAVMSDAQLAQPSTLAILNDMVNAATTAYQGKIDPATNQQQNGMSQLYPQVQKLATFTVTPYKK